MSFTSTGTANGGAIAQNPAPSDISEPVFSAAISGAMLTSELFSLPNVEDVRRRGVAERFARFARNMNGVREVWLDEISPELTVSVVLRQFDFERELELRGLFIEAVREALDLSVGELSVYSLDEGVPDAVRRGEQLA